MHLGVFTHSGEHGVRVGDELRIGWVEGCRVHAANIGRHAMIVPVQPAVVAHRGASSHRAEHTLAAYALALEQGADGLECDVRLTRDGFLVCVHDRRVDRTSTGRGAVSTLTL